MSIFKLFIEIYTVHGLEWAYSCKVLDLNILAYVLIKIVLLKLQYYNWFSSTLINGNFCFSFYITFNKNPSYRSIPKWPPHLPRDRLACPI